jgi:hypothetical protein
LHADNELRNLERSNQSETRNNSVTDYESISKNGEDADEAVKDQSVINMLLAADIRRPLTMGLVIMLFQQFSGVNAVVFYSG